MADNLTKYHLISPLLAVFPRTVVLSGSYVIMWVFGEAFLCSLLPKAPRRHVAKHLMFFTSSFKYQFSPYFFGVSYPEPLENNPSCLHGTSHRYRGAASPRP